MVLPLDEQLTADELYDPKTGKWTLVDMCTSSQHLMFAEDANNTLWFSNPGSDNVGWLNTKMYDETHDAKNRRAGRHSSWTPTATASGTNTPNPDSRWIPPKTCASRWASTA